MLHGTRASPDWKTGREVSTILEVLKECYPLAALDNLVSTYDKWYHLYKSMRTTITVDQINITLTRKQFFEQLISALADFDDIPADLEALFLRKFEKVFINFHNLHKDYSSNRLFQSDLKETLEKDAAYTAKPLHPTRHELVGEGCIPIPTTCRAWR
jgi:hypothetical protein